MGCEITAFRETAKNANNKYGFDIARNEWMFNDSVDNHRQIFTRGAKIKPEKADTKPKCPFCEKELETVGLHAREPASFVEKTLGMANTLGASRARSATRFSERPSGSVGLMLIDSAR